MAKKGEIDPWNIDVVDLADRFLKRVEESDLRVSARVLLYAAILVRMKAEILVSEAILEEDEELPVEIDLDIEIPVDREVPKLKPKKPKRYTTLQELIKELRRAEMTVRRRRRRRRVEETKVLEVPHEEDVEETVNRVYERILEEFRVRKEISFFKFTRNCDRGGVVSFYTSILHLAYRRKVVIHQERFYEDIKIRPPS